MKSTVPKHSVEDIEQIAGARSAGLAAAITLARAGRWVIYDDEVVPKGYAYLLVMNGRGTVVGNNSTLTVGQDGGTHSPGYPVISLARAVQFLQERLRQQWAILGHTQYKDHAFVLLAMLEKTLREEGGAQVIPS